MKKILIFLLFILSTVTSSFSQVKESVVRMNTSTSKFVENYLAKQLIRIADSNHLFALTHNVLIGQTMRIAINNNWCKRIDDSTWMRLNDSVVSLSVPSYISLQKVGKLNGVADSVLRIDWSNGGTLSMQSNPNCISDDILSKAFAYLPSSDTTHITTANHYYPIKGAFVTSPEVNFTVVSTPAIKYTGSSTQYFIIPWNATVSSSHTGCTIQCGIKKNTSLVTASVMTAYLKTSNELYSLSGVCVVSLSTNDEIQLIVTSDNGGDVITFHNYTTSIKTF